MLQQCFLTLSNPYEISIALISVLASLKCLELFLSVKNTTGAWKIHKNVKGVRFTSVPQTWK